jgi:hypothetical protein
MSKWDKYRIQESKPISTANRWDKYRIQPQQQKSVGQNINEYADVAGKSFNRGVLGLLDLPQLAATGVEELGNLIPGGTKTHHVSSLTPVSEHVTNLANKVGYEGLNKPVTDTYGKRILSHAGEFAGSIGPWGFLNKATKGANYLKNTLAGAGVGGTSGILQEGGVNPLTADIASTVVAPYTAAKLNPKNIYSAFQKLPETSAKIPMKLMGLGPKGLNIEAAQAARDLGIDLPAAALTESKLTGLADQLVGKTPHFGEKLGEKYANAEKQTKNVLDKIYEEVGPRKTPEIESEIAKLYDIRAKSLPQGAMIKPTHLEKAIDNIKINTAILSPEEKSLLQSLETIKNEIKPESNLITKFGKIKVPLQDFSVDKLVGTKKSLNQMIKWDTDEGIKNQLRSLQKAVAKDIEDYGRTNPEWYQSFKEADDLFSKVAKREKLETQLGGSINPSTDDLGYANLSKRIHAPKQMELIKKQVSPEIFAKIEKLGTVARAMAVKNRNIPNPSGTAITSAITGVLGTLYTPQTIAAVIGTAGVTKLLTDKKFLDLALRYAEKPNLITSMPLNKRIKDITGYSATVLNREMNRSRVEE